MTSLQTVKVPENRRVYFEVPREIPTGSTAQFEITWFPKPIKKEFDLDASIKKIQELCKDADFSVDSFLEKRRRDDEKREKQLLGEFAAEPTPTYGGSN